MSCGEPEGLSGFSPAAGGVVCSSCEGAAFPLGEDAYRFLVAAVGKPLAEAPDAADRALALVHGLAFVAQDTRNHAPRFPLDALRGSSADVPRLTGWYRRFIEIGPHPMLCGAIAEAAARLRISADVRAVMTRGVAAVGSMEQIERALYSRSGA